MTPLVEPKPKTVSSNNKSNSNSSTLNYLKTLENRGWISTVVMDGNVSI